MSKTLNVRQKQKSDLAASWTTNDPILLSGEIGIESDTGNIKVGDGATAWNDLTYVYKKKLTSSEISQIEEIMTWYNETYFPQAKQLKLDYLVGEANYIKSKQGDLDEYKCSENGFNLFNQIGVLNKELSEKRSLVFSLIREETIISDINLEGLRFYLYSAQFFNKANPILEDGAIGQELVTFSIKVGDGSTAWNDLPYYYEYIEETTENIEETGNSESEGG
ncbi:MAG: hypothetical protein ACI4R8_01090 [Candidatus Caccovivens sp.]